MLADPICCPTAVCVIGFFWENLYSHMSASFENICTCTCLSDLKVEALSLREMMFYSTAVCVIGFLGAADLCFLWRRTPLLNFSSICPSDATLYPGLDAQASSTLINHGQFYHTGGDERIVLSWHRVAVLPLYSRKFDISTTSRCRLWRGIHNPISNLSHFCI